MTAMVPVRRERIDFTQNFRYIMLFMKESDRNAEFVLSHLSHSTDRELFMSALKRLDNMNIRGLQIHIWYIMMISHYCPSKNPNVVLKFFMGMNISQLNDLVDKINQNVPKHYTFKAKLHLKAVK